MKSIYMLLNQLKPVENPIVTFVNAMIHSLEEYISKIPNMYSTAIEDIKSLYPENSFDIGYDSIRAYNKYNGKFLDLVMRLEMYRDVNEYFKTIDDSTLDIFIDYYLKIREIPIEDQLFHDQYLDIIRIILGPIEAMMHGPQPPPLGLSLRSYMNKFL